MIATNNIKGLRPTAVQTNPDTNPTPYRSIIMAPPQQKVLYLTKKNGPFEVHTADVPKAGPGQLLVKVEATGINPVDWKIQLWGLFIEKFPSILGSDIVGTVEELGEGVSGFAKGDRV